MSEGGFVACDALVGRPRVPLGLVDPRMDDLRSEIERLSFAGAVVRHRFCIEAHPGTGNRMLMEEIAGDPRLIPCWFLTPDGEEPSFDPARTVQEMMDAGVRLAWTDAEAESFSLKPWSTGRLMSELEQRRVPLLLDFAKLDSDDLAILLAEYPALPFVVLNVRRMGRHRALYPLLQRHSNLYLCWSPVFSVHYGYEDLCEAFGHDRWLFGSGYPEAEGGAAICGVNYSGLSEEARRAVGHLNLERLLEGVKA